MSGVRKIIALSKLKLDQNNPRHHPTNSQKEALDVMIKHDPDSLLTIAKHILENGLNPSVTTIVFKNERNQFIVKDGNRRVTALKCMFNPDIISEEYGNIRNKFKKMVGDSDISSLSKIDCIVFTDEAEADKWVENNHQGPQNGKGQDPWDAIEKLRYKQSKGKIIPELNVYDYIIEHIGFDDSKSEIPIDVLRRVVNTTEFKDWVGMDHTPEGMIISIPLLEFDMILKRIVHDVKNGIIDTRKLRKIDDRTEYINIIKGSLPDVHNAAPTMILPRQAIRNASEQDDKEESYTDTSSSENINNQIRVIATKDESKPGGPSRLLMFETLNWEKLDAQNDDHKSLIEIANELRYISLKKRYKELPLSAAFLIRAAYEQCMKLIIISYGLKLNNSKNLESLERQCIGLVNRLHDSGVVSTELKDSLELIDKDFVRQFLNYSVHGPGVIKATSLQLETIASKGMRSFIQLTINELESICAATGELNQST